MAHSVRALDTWGADQLSALIAGRPVRHCYPASRIESAERSFLRNTYSDLLGYFEDGHLRSGLLLGANVVPIETTSSARIAFAQTLARHGRRCSSIVGADAEVLELWALLEPHWGRARAVRECQPVMATAAPAPALIDDAVRYATRADLDSLVPACIEMFTAEVGVSPILHGGGAAYRNRVADLVDQRRSFVRMDEGRLVFKAEIGSVGAGVAQIQGVWVRPDLRGRGIAAPAMASVVRRVLDDIAPTASLYVNAFNTAALATYRRVGFEQVDTFATVLF